MASISEFYNNRDVFVTGATGFMGKVLVEKLLRCCPALKNVYVLIRPKKDHDVKQRLHQLQSSKVFDNLRKENPEAFQKLIGICGDVSESDLQLSVKDEQALIDNISVVFHCAATVKFDEEMKIAVKMNLMGTKHVIDLCHKMSKIEAFVHVSTAYCHCHKKYLEEDVWTMSPSPAQVVEALSWMDNETASAMFSKIMDGRPNTYAYTKALTEAMLHKESERLPIAIIRPSIVEASWKEPFPGWVDSLNASSGILLGGMKGVLRSGYCIAEYVMDTVPVDICINLMIAVAWYTSIMKPNGIMVYNCASGDINGHTWGEVVQYCVRSARKTPANNVLWYPTLSLQRSKYRQEFMALFVHWLPALLLDLASVLTGNKAVMIKIQQKVKKLTDCLEYFSTQEWHFQTDNLWAVWEKMSEEDRKCFNFDLRQIHWPTYYQNFCLGVRNYLLKEDPSTLPNARRHVQRMYYVRQISFVITFLILAFLLRFIYSVIFQ